MRSRWEELHAGLQRSIDRRESVASFQELQRRSPPLVPFGGPGAVAAFLASKGNSLVERDRILRCLVEEARTGNGKRIALGLLLLGFWPALDAIFRKRAPLFQREAPDIELEIIEQFIAQVHRIELSRVSCLGATLVRNTERDVVDARVRERARAAKCEDVTPDALAAPSVEDEPPFGSPSAFGVRVGQPDSEAIAALRRWLLSAIGSDADLIVGAVIHGKSRVDLAASLGISPAATRKRLERALDRARHAFLSEARSQTATPSAWVS
jgi:DNA-directed RNA polymerase specialized sigma24 family protein